MVERVHRDLGGEAEVEEEVRGLTPAGSARAKARLRRSAHVVVRVHDRKLVDIELLLRGEARLASFPQLAAVSIPKGEECPITLAELELLLRLDSTDFVPAESVGIQEATLERFVDAGLVVEEAGENGGRDDANDEIVDANRWNVWAALYHALARWRGVDFSSLDVATTDERVLTRAAEQLIRESGEPPPHFHSVPSAVDRVRLPRVEPQGDFYDVLRRRRTTRSFDREASLPLERLADVLDTTFGCRGLAPLGGGAMIAKKTSPSGGALHPTEAYPIVVRVGGIEPGLYHYETGSHTLALLEPLDAERAEALALAFACGQGYLGGACAYLILTSRFARLNWKYRDHARAYGVALMDAAHLSQTFYLVCTELGLGAFVTAAINVGDIDERLGLDGFSEGAVAICGCGVAAAAPGPFEPVFEPFSPGEER